MLYSWWGCRGNLTLITLGSERVMVCENWLGVALLPDLQRIFIKLKPAAALWRISETRRKAGATRDQFSRAFLVNCFLWLRVQVPRFWFNFFLGSMRPRKPLPHPIPKPSHALGVLALMSIQNLAPPQMNITIATKYSFALPCSSNLIGNLISARLKSLEDKICMAKPISWGGCAWQVLSFRSDSKKRHAVYGFISWEPGNAEQPSFFTSRRIRRTQKEQPILRSFSSEH